MKIKKITALLITAGLVLASLTACGNNDNNDDYVDWNNQQRENNSTSNENSNTSVDETLPASILPRYEQAINNRDVQALIDCYDPEFIAFMQGILNIGGSIGGAGSLGDNLGLMMPYLIRSILNENENITVRLTEISTEMNGESRATVVYKETLFENGNETETSEQSMTVVRIGGTWYIDEHGGIAPPNATPTVDISQYPISPEEDFGFRNVDGGVEIISYTGGAIMHIPATIMGQPVVSIGERIIANNLGFNENVTILIVPDSVRTIEEGAFYHSRNLTTVIFGNGVTSIGKGAFMSCEQLTGEIIIPDSVVHLGESAFRNSRMTSIVIGNGVNRIENQTFWGCVNLKSVTIGSSVISIGEGAFYECRSLESIVIPDNVTIIESSAFYLDFNNHTAMSHMGLGRGLKSVTIGNGVTSIGENAFMGTSLEEGVVIGNSVTSIGESAFARTDLASIIIPDSVTSIGSGAFSLTKLTSVTIGSGLTNIGAVFGSSALTSIVIPDTVTGVCIWAFSGSSLTRITYKGTTYGNVEDFLAVFNGRNELGLAYWQCHNRNCDCSQSNSENW